MTRPLPQRLRDVVGQLVAALDEIVGRLAEEHRRRGGAHHAGTVRLVERLQQAQPVLGGVGVEDVGVAGVHRGDVCLAQRAVTRARVLVALDDHRDIACLQRPAVEGGAVGQQASDVGRQVQRDVRAQVIDRDRSSSAAAELVTVHYPQPERVVTRCAIEPRTVVLRLDLVNDDPFVSEPRAAEQRLQSVHQRSVAAPVLAECHPHARGFRCVEVRDDVAAAERVDRLLRVADQDQRGPVGERSVDHLPLHGVGVLELVDHHDRPPLMHAHLGGRVVGVQRIGQPGEQVVVAEHAAAALADFQFGQNIFREVDAHRGAGVRWRLLRSELRRRMLDHLAGQPKRVFVVQQRVVAVEAEVAEVEVVDDLGDQLVEALDQRHTGVAVACHAERLEHHLAELVRGGDGRGVERRQRVAQPLTTVATFVVTAVEQMRDHLVVADGRRIVESHDSVDDLAPHAVAQLLRRGPAERDQQHLVQRRLALGDVAGDQTGQRERLARSCARLQHGGRPCCGQRTEQIEVVHQPSMAFSIGSHSRRA